MKKEYISFGLLEIFLALIVSDIQQTTYKINILTCKEIIKNMKFYVLSDALEHKSQQKMNEKKSRLIKFLGDIMK